MSRILSLAAAIVALFCATAQGATTQLPPGKTCFEATVGISGMVGTLGTIVPGTGGSAGTYTGVALTGGSGINATANITVSGGGVTAVIILNAGTQYIVGDSLSAASGNIGGVSGFSVPVASTSINGSLAGGSVAMYVPGTTTTKVTYQDSNQTVANPQPIPLDANGCSLIFGSGSYRQQLFDSLGNLVWDQVVQDPSSFNSTFWAGQAGGTANAITVTDAGFNATDGSIINFIPIATNTGATTLNPSNYFGSSPPSVVKDTTGGPVALVGGEIIAPVSGTPNVVSVIYSATQGNFHLLNTAIPSASGATAPLCGASGLVITNGGTPNSIISLTARQIVMQTSAGLTINRSNVSLTNINITTGTSTSTANGMDGEAVGTNAWLQVWAIDNGAAPAGLVSLAAGNGQSPVLPSGYNYKCFLGSMRVNGSGNLLTTTQKGTTAAYVVGAGTVTALPSIVSGSSGSISTPTWTAEAVAAFVPPTATQIDLLLQFEQSTSSAVAAMAAPNNSYGAYSSNSNPPPLVAGAIYTTTGNFFTNQSARFVLESANVYYASNVSTAALFAKGWVDAVNAN